jgi:CHAD domain-containing protein
VATRFKNDRPLKRSVRKIAHGLIDRCLENLAVTAAAERDEAIHDARKGLKKLRSLLRLVRPVIARSDYRRENERLRDAGLPLTQARDLKILIESLDAVVKECFADGQVPEKLLELRRGVSDELSREHEHLQADGELEAISNHLKEARDDVRKWAGVPDRWRTLSRGLKATYARVLESQRGAEKEPTAESCHEWRKQVRYLRYQLGLVRFLNPERLTGLAGQIDRVNKLLGSSRDLTLLEKRLFEDRAVASEGALLERLQGIINRRRRETTAEACSVAETLFAETPEEFVAALKRDWKNVRSSETVES